MRRLRVLDLFSGIGGFSLGLERAGFETVAFCERDHFCREVLANRWPGIACYHDITKLDAAELVRDHGRIDCLCGGFPCQDISLAGKGAGIAGEKSGLWKHYHRLIRELRPDWVIVENVSALRSRGLDVVLGDLAAIGYDAEWHCIPAAYVGAPHRRDRVWIVAYPNGGGLEVERQQEHSAEPGACGSEPHRFREAGRRERPSVADAEGQRSGSGFRETVKPGSAEVRAQLGNGRAPVVDANRERREEYGGVGSAEPELGSAERASWWQFEPDVGRVADGIPARVDRLRALGNAIVPQIAEMIGVAIQRALL